MRDSRIRVDIIKKLKVFHLIKSLVCTLQILCCHLLNVTGCVKKLQKRLKTL